MKPLGMTFRLDDIIESGRDLQDVISMELVEASVSGLIGNLGYRAVESASVDGKIYRTANDEVIVDMRLRTAVQFDCVRCLEGSKLRLDVRLDHVLVKGESKPAAEELELTDADLKDEVDTFEGDEINIEPIVRQDLILSLPMNPTCDDGDVGPCKFDSETINSEEDSVDPRWAPLADLKKKLKPTNGSDE